MTIKSLGASIGSLGGIPESEKGAPNGVAELGPDGKIPLDEMPIEVWSYQGDWNVATNDPSLTDGIGTLGWTYLVSTGGTRDTGHGNIVWNIGDVAVYDGVQWDQIPHGGQFFIQSGGQSAASMLVIGTTNAQSFRILTDNFPRITVDSIGNVGIGVDSPTAPLHVAGAMIVVAGPVQTSWDPTSGTVLQLGTLSNHNVNIATNNVTRMTVAANGDAQMASGYTPANPRSLATKEYVDTPATQLGTITSYNGIATAGAGVPPIYAKYDSAAHSANIAPTTIYTVPASGAGMYRVFVYAVETTAATTSSTLPNVGILWTDSDANVALSSSNVSPTNPANAPGAFGNGAIVINARASTTIQFQTSNYASAGATAMQYAVHLRLEYLG